ncbi:AAWKG family protein [Streptomyces sp. 11x1]|uniref:AAWKG family protein n=1 Tax=Streptomyces sp. 11x1 TaxID=3038642 RepID=UPI00292EDDAE|nr:AAWKG family protein [Streptomyces sp. 11x1]WNZ08044.1 AAWKG family protein [Streptomyces sp. 11x1]
MADNTPEDDYWSTAVSSFTGYKMPERGKLFEKLKSDKGVPLFRHEVESLGVRAVQPSDIGRNVRQGEDYDIVFYSSSGGDGRHDGVKMHRVRIVMIGVIPDANGRATFFSERDDPLGEGWGDNNTFTGIGKIQWDASDMARYIFGGRRALGALTDSYSTKDFSYAGQSVLDSSAVDLLSFTRTAQSFDRAKGFLVQQAETLGQWERALGSERSAWRGKAAGVFRGLVKQLHKNYAGYADQLGGKGYQGTHLTVDGYLPTSKPGHAVTVAQRNLLAQAKELAYAWQDWADSGRHDPHRVVNDLLADLVKWLIANNHPHVLSHDRGSDPDGSELPPTYSTSAAFRQVHPVYGDLRNDQAWKTLGERAVRIWRETQDAYVETPARNALSRLGNGWLQTSKDVVVALRTRDTTPLTEAYRKEEARLAKEKAEKDGDSLSKTLNSLGGFGKQMNKAMEDFGNNMGKGLGGFGNQLNKGLNDFGQGMNKNLNDFGEGMSKGLNGATKGIGDNVSSLNKGLNDFGQGLNKGLNGATKGIGDTVSSLNQGGIGGYLGGILGGNGNPTHSSDPSAKNTAGGIRNPDGSTTVLNPDGSLTAKYPDGSVQTVNPPGTTPFPQPFPSPGTVTTPSGSTTKLNADGTLTTTYPDGTKETVDPSKHTVSTTTPDGKTHTDSLRPGHQFTNPDGSTTALNPNGSLTTKYPDGSVQTINPDGSVTTSQPHPSSGTVTTPSGSTTKLNADGTLTTTYPDGTKETVDPSKNTVSTTTPDGKTHTDSLRPGHQFTNPDGSTTALNPDGSLTTKYRDGSVQTINPDGSVTTTTDLNGSSTGKNTPGSGGHSGTSGHSGSGTSGLNHHLPSPSSFDLRDFDTSGLNGHQPMSTPLSPALAGGTAATGDGGADSYEDYDSIPYAGGALGAPTDDSTSSSAAQESTGGMPLNPMAFGGMGGMGGMGGTGGGGTGGSNGERVRSVLSDGDGAALRRRRRSRGAASADDEEDVVVTRGGRPVTASTPYAPMGMDGGQGGRSTESGDRVRSNWGTEEDDDVWGTDEGGAPAVIGR